MSDPVKEERVGHFLIKPTVLGKGAWSVVRSAIDTRSGAEVASKIIDKARLERLGGKDLLERAKREGMEETLREVIVMRCLPSHRNIVKLLDVVETGQAHYIFQEKLQEDLGSVILDMQSRYGTGLPESRVRRYFRHIVCGLGCMHSMGILHRDLKPENMLLNDNDIVKLTDFGLAKRHPKSRNAVTVPEEMSKELVGTYRYSAPEMFSPTSNGYDGFLADVWSLGVCLFVLLTGSFPFPMPPGAERDPKSEWADLLRESELIIPAQFSPAVRDLLHRLLVKNPCDRIKLDEALDHPWLTNDKPSLTVEDAMAECDFFKAQVKVLKVQLTNERTLREKAQNSVRSHSSAAAIGRPISPALPLPFSTNAEVKKSAVTPKSTSTTQRCRSPNVKGNVTPAARSQSQTPLPSAPKSAPSTSVTRKVSNSVSPLSSADRKALPISDRSVTPTVRVPVGSTTTAPRAGGITAPASGTSPVPVPTPQTAAGPIVRSRAIPVQVQAKAVKRA